MIQQPIQFYFASFMSFKSAQIASYNDQLKKRKSKKSNTSFMENSFFPAERQNSSFVIEKVVWPHLKK